MFAKFKLTTFKHNIRSKENDMNTFRRSKPAQTRLGSLVTSGFVGSVVKGLDETQLFSISGYIQVVMESKAVWKAV